jgi:hypothetical protein
MGLMIGPAVPIPAPREVMEALTGVEITTASTGASGFQLTFNLSKRSPLHTLFMLAGGAAPLPLVRVVIYVTVNGITEVLMDGVMTNHQVTGGGSSGEPQLSVTGEDLSRVMDYIDFSGIPYPAMPDFARVLVILAKYAVFGIVPLVIPSVLIDVPVPLERIPLHDGKDLGYIRRLANRVGYVFYIEPGPAPGMSKAYWGPEIRVGVPQPALNVDMDVHTNVESLSFGFDSERATLPIAIIQNQATKVPIPIPIPPVTPLSPPLGLVPPVPKRIEYMTGLAQYNPIQAAMIGLAKAARSMDVVTANGTLNVLRYGRVLRARKLVGVRGGGHAFDGLYYVNRVTHSISRGEYKQSFSLVRNALVSNLPRIPV